MGSWLHPKKTIDFVKMRNMATILSVLAVSASLALFFFVGPTWGIDFTGGTEVHLKFKESTQINELRTALEDEGLGSDSVQQVGTPEDNEFVVRIQDPEFGTEELKGKVLGALQGKFGNEWIKESSFDAQIGARLMVVYNGDPIQIADVQNSLKGIEGATATEASDDNTLYIKLPGISTKLVSSLAKKFPNEFTVENGVKISPVQQVDSVGPKVGSELRQQGFISIMATLALILVYVAFRFNISFAPGAVLALFHDVTIVVGVFIILDMAGWTHEFNLPMIGALLTIIGYSLNDTIVIYDRIRENMTRYRRQDLGKLINGSINETLGRTLATSLTTMMGMTAFLILGGAVIQTFALAIFLGVIVGTYSTVFVASPTILVMQDLQPYLTKIFSPLTEDEVSDEEEVLSESEKRRRERSGKVESAV